jgi:hypothetical protein
MKHYTVQLRRRGFAGALMHLVERADSPPQD